MTEAASKGRRARRKGAAWQAELARRWRESGLYPDAASTQGAQTRSGRKLGKTPPDVEGTPFWVEAKHTRAANPVGALRQAERERAANGDQRPAIAVVKPSGDRLVGPVVCMRLETFEALLRGTNEGQGAPPVEIGSTGVEILRSRLAWMERNTRDGVDPEAK